MLNLAENPQLQLHEFPAAIAQLQLEMMATGTKLRLVQTRYNSIVARFEAEIAFDKNLSNENQRKARRLELFQGEEYQQIAASLTGCEDELKLHQIALQRLISAFDVAKLALNARIAHLDLTGEIYVV